MSSAKSRSCCLVFNVLNLELIHALWYTELPTDNCSLHLPGPCDTMFFPSQKTVLHIHYWFLENECFSYYRIRHTFVWMTDGLHSLITIWRSFHWINSLSQVWHKCVICVLACGKTIFFTRESRFLFGHAIPRPNRVGICLIISAAGFHAGFDPILTYYLVSSKMSSFYVQNRYLNPSCTKIDQSHRCGHHQATCREPAGSYDKTTRTAICFENIKRYIF